MNFVTTSGKTYNMPVEMLHADAVRKEITKNDHPHPSIILSIVIITLIIMYIVYTLAIKSNFSGTWYTNNMYVNINHNSFTDTIVVNNSFTGSASGSALYIKTNNGVMHGVVDNKKIYWTGNTDTWTRIN